jgi:hypothetical protein
MGSVAFFFVARAGMGATVGRISAAVNIRLD